MTSKKTSRTEEIFENFLWNSRLITLLAVIFSLISSLSLFAAGSYQIWNAVITAISASPDSYHDTLLPSIIGSVDLYLIAIVLLIFSFGIYELFISKIDPAKHNKEINILEIKNLDDLKNRLLKVMIMALIVHFFKSILNTHFETSLELLYMGLSILAISACIFFIRKVE